LTIRISLSILLPIVALPIVALPIVALPIVALPFRAGIAIWGIGSFWALAHAI
jgi:hypothetical protein